MTILPDVILPPGLLAARPAAGSRGRLYYATDTALLYRDNGASWDQYAPAGGGMYESYCCIVDQKPQNTGGGAFVTGAWRTRDINTEQADPDGIVAIAANQFVLDAGTYSCFISAPAYYVTFNFAHQARLYNATDAAVLITGQNQYTQQPGAGAGNSSIIIGRFTVGSSKSLEIQHRCTTTYASGFGIQGNWTVEIYTVAQFWKES